MNNASAALSALRRLSIAIAVAIVFLFGLATTVYLSLRSPEVTVPDVMGKDRFEAERILGKAGLNFRVRATRPSNELKADTVLFQLPRSGEVVKTGQTVAMDISRTVKEGESSEVAAAPEKKPEEKTESNSNENKNTNDNSANENKPKRPKNANKNANANGNDNSNTATRNANANRASGNRNSNSAAAPRTPGENTARPPLIINNARPAANDNAKPRPPAPKPSPQ